MSNENKITSNTEEFIVLASIHSFGKAHVRALGSRAQNTIIAAVDVCVCVFVSGDFLLFVMDLERLLALVS